MPVISIDFDDFIDLLGKEISQDEFIEKVPLIGADVERIQDNQIDIEFFPDRPDLYSVEGVARAMRAFLEYEPGLKAYSVKRSDTKMVVDQSVLEVRPWVVCGLVRNVVFTDPFVKSIMDVQEKLHLTLGRKRKKVSIGIHDFDNVKPPFTYKAVDPESVQFIPLGMNEYMDMEEILRKHEKGIEYKWILEGFSTYPIITDVNHEVLSFPPIINGIATTVTENSSNIFLDITGLDLNGCNTALNIIAGLLAERGGDIETVEVQYPDNTLITPDLEPKIMKLDIDYTNKYLGTEFSDNEIINYLTKMGFDAKLGENVDKAKNTSKKELDVSIPPYRSDILHPIDLVEDVAIGMGYESFEPIQPKNMTYGRLRELESFSQRLRNILVGLSFNEVMTLSLSNPKEQFELLGFDTSGELPKTVTIQNPRTEDFTMLRTSLIPALLTTLRNNKHRDLPQRIFEISDVVSGSTLKNHRYFAGAIIHAKANFTEIKSIVDNILQTVVGSKEIILKAKAHPAFIPGRCVAVETMDKTQKQMGELGYFGELHPTTITGFDLGYPVIAFEFDAEGFM
jgi:phenylalanyl-tRNA synthetase beta chain